MVEHENGKEDSKEEVTNSEEKTGKKRVQRKAKRNAAQALLLTAIFGLSAPAFVSVLFPELFIVLLGSSAAVSRLFTALPGSSVVIPGLSATILELSAAVSELSAPASAFISIPELSAVILTIASILVLFWSSTLLFSALSLSKTLTLNLAAKR